MQLLLHVEILTVPLCDALDGRKLQRLFVEYVRHRCRRIGVPNG
jgi:hypothetical protein